VRISIVDLRLREGLEEDNIPEDGKLPRGLLVMGGGRQTKRYWIVSAVMPMTLRFPFPDDRGYVQIPVRSPFQQHQMITGSSRLRRWRSPPSHESMPVSRRPETHLVTGLRPCLSREMHPLYYIEV